MAKEVGKDQITVSSTAVGFTAANVPGAAEFAICVVETTSIRMGSADNVPTATDGLELLPGAIFGIVGRGNILNARFIRVISTDATLTARFFSQYDVPIISNGPAILDDGTALVIGSGVFGRVAGTSTMRPIELIGSVGDAESQFNDQRTLAAGALQYLWNGASYDRGRNVVRTAYLASAARTADTNGADRTNYNFRGLVIMLNVTAFTTALSLTPRIEAKDQTSANYRAIATAAAALIATGQVMFCLYPTAENIEGWTEHWNQVLGSRTYRVVVAHGNANSATYSVDVVELV